MIDILYAILLVPFVAAVGMILGLLYKGIDRVLAARMQARVGPPVNQPYRDIKKLMAKESIVPKNAIGWLFNLMPVIALASSIALLPYIPLGGFAPIMEGHGDMLLVLYLLLIPSLALVIGGFSSGSPYATVGSQREMVSMVSYEFPLGITIVSVAWLISLSNPGAAVYSLGVISGMPVWSLVGPIGTAGLAMMFIALLFVMPGELGATPFDVGEAETEIAGGLLAEYSGRNLALFYLANAVKTFVFGSIVIALFMPFGISGVLGLSGLSSIAADLLFFLFKLFLVVFAGSIFMRVAVARLRINQVVKAYWGYGALVSLSGLLLICVDVLLGGLI